MPTARNDSARSVLARLLHHGSPPLEVAERFRARGHELYLVGGYLRDALLDRSPGGDLDFATDASPDQTHDIVKPLATHVWLQGMRFGTVGAEIGGEGMEITTFRTERYAAESRHPDVAFETEIATDLSRRDFTINAIALRLPERVAVDPFGGVEDLGARLIKTPGDPIVSFTDDPLRMLRAFRFASQLGFEIVDGVLEAVTKLKEQMRTVSRERVRDELSKLLVGGAPRRALELADSTGLTEQFVPELGALKLEQDPVHQHKDVFAHTLAVIEHTRPELELRLAAMLHDIGKPKTRRFGPEGVSFHHHEVVGAEMAKRRLQELRYPNETVRAVTEIIRLHHRFHTYRLGWSDSAVRRYVRDAGVYLEPLNELVAADCTTRNRDKARRLAERIDELRGRIAELEAREELARIRPELDGNDVMAYLGVPPGRVVGEALAHLLEIRLDEGPIGRDEALERLRSWALERGIDPGE
ncbi:CCA tRNA nucleotidyltransferase [soil metagenome]